MEEDVFDSRPVVKLKVLNKLPENPEQGHGRFPSWLHRQILGEAISLRPMLL
jgi:hypothetical protein